ncbi:MAG: efflux RND transporter periplasmic adaptor subunit [Nitrospirota bacterium]
MPITFASLQRRWIAVAAVLLLAAIGAGTYWFWPRAKAGGFKTAKAERGDLVTTVSATGTLSAVVTVQVGSQVSGTIQSLGADFNSQVRKGHVIARIDPSLFDAQVKQAEANLATSEAALARARLARLESKRNSDRMAVLSAKGMVSSAEADAALTAFETSVAQEKAGEAEVQRARAALEQAQVNLRNTVITSPIDGTVISRNVDVGQTVAASLQAPTLFTIAQDLTKMQVEAAIDESDVGQLKEGQPATFTVDAFPAETFSGRVTQIRKAPVIVQNVVTYTALVAVANERLILRPGMTATVSVRTGEYKDALLVPNAAFRVKVEQSARKPASGPAAAGARKEKPAGTRTIWVLEDGKAFPREVVIGANNPDKTIIASGLKEGEAVIVESQAKNAKKPGAGGWRGFL